MTDEQQTTESTEPTENGGIPKEARTMGMLVHLLALCGLVGIPFGNVLGPLILWLIKKEDHPFIDDQGKESLNFQITAMIAGLVLTVLSIIPFAICLTLPLIGALVLVVAVYVVIAAMKANEGVAYRYPYSLKLIS